MAKRQAPKRYKPRWHKTAFGLLLVGYYFKASRTNSTWWVKRTDGTASSENRGLWSGWSIDDTVWIDLNMSLSARDRFVTG